VYVILIEIWWEMTNENIIVKTKVSNEKQYNINVMAILILKLLLLSKKAAARETVKMKKGEMNENIWINLESQSNIIRKWRSGESQWENLQTGSWKQNKPRKSKLKNNENK